MRTFSRSGNRACARCQADLLSLSEAEVTVLGLALIVNVRLDLVGKKQRAELVAIDPSGFD